MTNFLKTWRRVGNAYLSFEEEDVSHNLHRIPLGCKDQGQQRDSR